MSERPQGGEQVGHSAPTTSTEHTVPAADSDGTIIPAEERRRLSARWDDIQVDFVEDPRRGIEQADDLVGEVIDHLRADLDRRRGEFHKRLAAGEDSTTEQLRMALQEYRSFFDKLLHTRQT